MGSWEALWWNGLGGRGEWVRVLFWYGLEVVLLTVVVRGDERNSQSMSYCLRSCQ